MPAPRELLVEKLRDRFLIVWTTHTTDVAQLSIVSATVYEKAGEDTEGVWVYGDNYEEDHTKSEVYLKVVIKWDGCSTLDVQGGLHLCGSPCWVDHIFLMQHLFLKASELMGYTNNETEDGPWPLTITEA